MVGSMVVGSMVVGSMVVGSMVVGSMVVGSMVVGSMVVGSMVVGSMEVGSMVLRTLYYHAIGRFRSTIFRAKIRRGSTDFFIRRFRAVKCSGVRNLCVCRHCLGYDRKHVTFPRYAFIL